MTRPKQSLDEMNVNGLSPKLTVSDMSTLLRRDVGGIYALRAKGTLPAAYKVGGVLLWDADEVAEWLAGLRDKETA